MQERLEKNRYQYKEIRPEQITIDPKLYRSYLEKKLWLEKEGDALHRMYAALHGGNGGHGHGHEEHVENENLSLKDILRETMPYWPGKKKKLAEYNARYSAYKEALEEVIGLQNTRVIPLELQVTFEEEIASCLRALDALEQERQEKLA